MNFSMSILETIHNSIKELHKILEEELIKLEMHGEILSKVERRQGRQGLNLLGAAYQMLKG